MHFSYNVYRQDQTLHAHCSVTAAVLVKLPIDMCMYIHFVILVVDMTQEPSSNFSQLLHEDPFESWIGRYDREFTCLVFLYRWLWNHYILLVHISLI
jgi:hypothetical protein